MKTKQEIGSKYDKLQRSRNSKRKIQEDKKQVVKAIKRRKMEWYESLAWASVWWLLPILLSVLPKL